MIISSTRFTVIESSDQNIVTKKCYFQNFYFKKCYYMQILFPKCYYMQILLQKMLLYANKCYKKCYFHHNTKQHKKLGYNTHGYIYTLENENRKTKSQSTCKLNFDLPFNLYKRETQQGRFNKPKQKNYETNLHIGEKHIILSTINTSNDCHRSEESESNWMNFS
jgi:hypothetical protein